MNEPPKGCDMERARQKPREICARVRHEDKFPARFRDGLFSGPVACERDEAVLSHDCQSFQREEMNALPLPLLTVPLLFCSFTSFLVLVIENDPAMRTKSLVDSSRAVAADAPLRRRLLAYLGYCTGLQRTRAQRARTLFDLISVNFLLPTVLIRSIPNAKLVAMQATLATKRAFGRD